MGWPSGPSDSLPSIRGYWSAGWMGAGGGGGGGVGGWVSASGGSACAITCNGEGHLQAGGGAGHGAVGAPACTQACNACSQGPTCCVVRVHGVDGAPACMHAAWHPQACTHACNHPTTHMLWSTRPWHRWCPCRSAAPQASWSPAVQVIPSGFKGSGFQGFKFRSILYTVKPQAPATNTLARHFFLQDCAGFKGWGFGA